jgi:hypothetical protein
MQEWSSHPDEARTKGCGDGMQSRPAQQLLDARKFAFSTDETGEGDR